MTRMSTRNHGLIADTLFVGATRPPMRWGVTYSALLFNLVFTLESFLLSKNLLALLLCLPIHGVCALLCLRDARFFDLILLWGRTRLPGLLANHRVWQAGSYSPLPVASRAGAHRGRTAEPRLHIWIPGAGEL
jgi:type IV secretion system protein VirB3